MMEIEIGSCGKDCIGNNIPFIGISTIKGFGFWAGINNPYQNICIWLPFFIVIITLPKFIKKKQRKKFQFKFRNIDFVLRFNSFGFHISKTQNITVRLPFLDILI